VNLPARLNLIVEGQTEETFVRDLLASHLGVHGVFVSVRCIETSRSRKKGKIYRGGATTYERAQRDIQRWLREDAGAHFSTMFDLYALPVDFPGIEAARKTNDVYEKVRRIEEALASDIGDRRFIPYIQLHEFEGLLFSSVAAIDEILLPYAPSRLPELEAIRNRYKTPEEIDDGQDTAPSKRLADLYSNYDKVSFGLRIAARIGLDVIRRECPHFSQWLGKLESLGGAQP